MRCLVTLAVSVMCLYSANTLAQNSNTPALLQADTFSYDQNKDVFTATGKVELEQEGQMVFADTLVYDRAHDQVSADGHVIIVDKTGQTYFAQHIDLQNKLKTGAVEQIGLVFADGSRAAARYGEQKSDNTTVLHDAVYSPCNLCAEDPHKAPLWQ